VVAADFIAPARAIADA